MKDGYNTKFSPVQVDDEIAVSGTLAPHAVDVLHNNM